VCNDLYWIPEYSKELCHYAIHQQTVFTTASECHEFKTKQCNSRTETTPVSASYAVRPGLCKAGFHCHSFQHGDGTDYEAWRHLINVSTVTQSVYTETNKSVLQSTASEYKYSDWATKAMENLNGEADPPYMRHPLARCRRRIMIGLIAFSAVPQFFPIFISLIALVLIMLIN
jgi:hypothetical protein